MRRVIGIDFGTSTTYMNVKRYDGDQPDGDRFTYIPVVFNYGESSGYVASIIRENADGSFDFGEKASEPLEGAKIYTEIKMRLESQDEAERFEARRVTREFFKFLYLQYAQQLQNLGGTEDEEETVVSYPVKWRRETANFMLEAAPLSKSCTSMTFLTRPSSRSLTIGEVVPPQVKEALMSLSNMD